MRYYAELRILESQSVSAKPAPADPLNRKALRYRQGSRFMSLSELLVQARRYALEKVAPLEAPYPAHTIFLSVSDGNQRARVVHASHATFDEAWKTAAARCRRLVEREKLQVRWLRADWPTSATQRDWKTLKEILKNTKRNYFRFGLALDSQLKHAFLEQELNANAMLYGGNQVAHAILNGKNFRRYAGLRYRNPALDFSDDAQVIQLATAGVFCTTGSSPLALHGAGRNAGRRVIERLTPADVHGLVASSSRYLASQVQASGRFHYGWHACFDRPIRTYNSLRHASTTYAMVEAWEVTGDADLKAAIDRSLRLLTDSLIQEVTLPDGQPAAFLIDAQDEIKLGGNAVCLLALVQYSQATGSREHLPLLEKLALGIAHMQDPQSGRFVHVLNYPDLSVKEPFRIIYYDGEAAFGLMRLYGLTGDPRWLAMVERAFDHFIDAEHWKAHDHWLSYCVNELTRYRNDERYYRFGLQNVADHLGFVASRITTFPTLLELMMAAEQMVQRLKASAEHSHLLKGLDLTRFYQALEFRAHYLLNGHFFPEVAMYFQNPARILGSFYIRHHAFRVRIDDVEHYLSGYVAYLRYVERGREVALAESSRETRQSSRSSQPIREGPNWDQERLVAATPGHWQKRPDSPQWQATGLAFNAFTAMPGGIVAVRPTGQRLGVTHAQLQQLPFTPQALLVQDGEADPPLPVPTYRVPNLQQAILDMAVFARSQMQGKVIGVTGSAGKTTAVAMLKHLLQLWGETGSSAHNANLPLGIAWNLATVPWSARHQIIEMAIGSMSRNSRLVRPDVALFLNVAPAHLEYHGSTAEIARRKSRIFSSMAPGQHAVINRDLAEWPIILEAAQARQLKVISFGRHPDSDIRRVGQQRSEQGMTLTVDCRGTSMELKLPVLSDALAENAMACLAVLEALQLPLHPAASALSTFQLPAGRGQATELVYQGRHITLIDDAYNANPRSMHAMLGRLASRPQPRQRLLLVLGDMLELSDNSNRYHADMLPHIIASQPSEVFLLGSQMAQLAPHLQEHGISAHTFEEPQQLSEQLIGRLKDRDRIAVKGSHGSHAFRVVDQLKRLSS